MCDVVLNCVSPKSKSFCFLWRCIRSHQSQTFHKASSIFHRRRWNYSLPAEQHESGTHGCRALPMQQECSFRAIVVHLQQYHCVTVTTPSIINEEHFLIMAIYSHSCVYFCEKVWRHALNHRQDCNVNRCFQEKKTIIMQIWDGIIMDVFIIYRFGFALCYRN